MSDERLPPWLLPMWRRVTAAPERLHHALLLIGPHGSGKRRFAELLAQRLLCTSPLADGFACGQCPACRWFADGNHPDMHRMVPESAEEDDGEGESEGKKEKKKSNQIRIEQVRDMQGLLEIGGHQGGRRVVLIDPAEAMNVPTANALLKSLEEPPIDAVFLLVCHAPGQLLPTIRSRCQAWVFPKPSAAEASAWLAREGTANAEALLGFASGLPLAARELADGPLGEARARFAKDVIGLMNQDPLKLAGEWEAWLKGKAATEAGVTQALLVSWLQRWLADGVRVGQGQPARFFADYHKQLAQGATGHAAGWLAAYQELAAFRKVAQHPLNARLFLEDVLLRAKRGMAR
ncbi:MAG: DNA polymerase III subunit delta' [Rhodocyclaceae bacterium]